MTKYRLKKDLPDLEAGAIFDLTENLDDDTSSMFDSTGTYRFDKDDIKHFDEWFEEVQESGWWKPKNGEEYYAVSSHGVVGKATFDPESKLDCEAISMGNCFKTEKAAERYAKYLKAITTVRQDEGVLTPEQINELERIVGDAYCIAYTDNQNDEEEVLCRRTVNLSNTWAPVGAILFDTEKHAEASLYKHPNEWKVIANYDWRRK